MLGDVVGDLPQPVRVPPGRFGQQQVAAHAAGLLVDGGGDRCPAAGDDAGVQVGQHAGIDRRQQLGQRRWHGLAGWGVRGQAGAGGGDPAAGLPDRDVHALPQQLRGERTDRVCATPRSATSPASRTCTP
jgi:hypothetical protein